MMLQHWARRTRFFSQYFVYLIMLQLRVRRTSASCMYLIYAPMVRILVRNERYLQYIQHIHACTEYIYARMHTKKTRTRAHAHTHRGAHTHTVYAYLLPPYGPPSRRAGSQQASQRRALRRPTCMKHEIR